MSKSSRLARIDVEFDKDMREVMKIRLSKGLALPRLEEISLREATKLARRTVSYQSMLEELKTKPKRR